MRTDNHLPTRGHLRAACLPSTSKRPFMVGSVVVGAGSDQQSVLEFTIKHGLGVLGDEFFDERPGNDFIERLLAIANIAVRRFTHSNRLVSRAESRVQRHGGRADQ